MNNLAKLAGPKISGDLQPSTSKDCSPISNEPSASREVATIHDMLQKEILKELVKSKENAHLPSGQIIGDYGKQMTLQVEANFTLDFHIDLD